MTQDRATLVIAARESIDKGSKSFAMASKLFDAKTRERAWLLYSWCRKCDDLADGQEHGGALSTDHDAKAAVAHIRALTGKALAGEATGDPAFDALGLVTVECNIPHEFAYDLIEGFAMDAAEWRPRAAEDLLKYCYHVAGVVGKMMAVIMGVSPDDTATLERANHLGLAFQIANIMRDISEDDIAGRCYIPEDWLADVGIGPGEQLKPHNRAALAAIAVRMAEMAQDYESSARIGARSLPFRARWAVLAAAGIYGDIARKVAAQGEHAWDHRVITTKAAKLGWVVKAYAQAL